MNNNNLSCNLLDIINVSKSIDMFNETEIELDNKTEESEEKSEDMFNETEIELDNKTEESEDELELESYTYNGVYYTDSMDMENAMREDEKWRKIKSYFLIKK